MPRQPRIELPGVPLHIVQRGVDRRACFNRASNYWRYLDDLAVASRAQGCDIHAYVLMTNHVHLLATPSSAGSVSRMMQQLGRRYVRYFNACEARTGTLWEGRFRSCPVDSDTYLLRCMRYIELNPVRAGMTHDPGGYRWSSYHHHALGRTDALLTTHPQYLMLARTPDQRRLTYAQLVADGLSARHVERLRECTAAGKAWGTHAFQSRMAFPGPLRHRVK
jgi:putative transposase